LFKELQKYILKICKNIYIFFTKFQTFRFASKMALFIQNAFLSKKAVDKFLNRTFKKWSCVMKKIAKIPPGFEVQ